MPEAIALYDRAVVILEKGDALGGGHVSHRKRVLSIFLAEQIY
jgi:hypothetical protein